MRPDSYKRWAIIMVCATVKPRLVSRFCCSVEVVNGAAGVRFLRPGSDVADGKGRVFTVFQETGGFLLVLKRWFSSALISVPSLCYWQA